MTTSDMLADQQYTAEAQNKPPSKSKDKATKNKEDGLEQAVEKAALDITSRVSDAVRQQEKPKTLRQILSQWWLEQISRLSQAALAVLVALLVALLTPWFVKLQLGDTLTNASKGFLGSFETSGALKLLEENAKISQEGVILGQQSVQAIEGLSTLKAQIEDQDNGIKGALDGIAYAQQELLSQIEFQSQRIDNLGEGLSSSIEAANRVQRVNGDPELLRIAKQSRAIIAQIDSYVAEGRRLRVTDSLDSGVDAWISEVYFFVTLIPQEMGQVDQIKAVMKQIHLSERPYSDDELRLERSLIILSALKRWLSTPAI